MPKRGAAKAHTPTPTKKGRPSSEGWVARILQKVEEISATDFIFCDLVDHFGPEGATLHQALADALNGFLTTAGSTKKLLTTAECIFPSGEVEDWVDNDHTDGMQDGSPSFQIVSGRPKLIEEDR
jgi:hypothetical protein